MMAGMLEAQTRDRDELVARQAQLDDPIWHPSQHASTACRVSYLTNAIALRAADLAANDLA